MCENCSRQFFFGAVSWDCPTFSWKEAVASVTLSLQHERWAGARCQVPQSQLCPASITSSFQPVTPGTAAADSKHSGTVEEATEAQGDCGVQGGDWSSGDPSWTQRHVGETCRSWSAMLPGRSENLSHVSKQ